MSCNIVVIVCENGIYAHFDIFFCLTRLVRKKDVAKNSVFMGFVYHFLREVRLKELYLFTAEFYCSIYYIVRSVEKMTYAYGNIGSVFFELLYLHIGLEHKIAMLFAIVLADERDYLFHRVLGVILGVRKRLYVDI